MFVVSWNAGVWYSGNRQRKCSFSWEMVWEKCAGCGALPTTVFFRAHYRASPLTSFSSSLRRSERAFFLPIYNIVILFCIFPSSFLFLFSLFLERGQDKARRQIPLIPGALMEFLGLSNHKYFFSYLNVEKV